MHSGGSVIDREALKTQLEAWIGQTTSPSIQTYATARHAFGGPV
jgi:hypothetical protein